MEFVVLGRADEGPPLRLDYRRFAYAGKFVTSDTGKAVVLKGTDASELRDRERPSTAPEEYDDGVFAAVSFSPDRERPGVLWVRYVAVRDDHRGEGLGPRLCRFVVERAAEWDYGTCRIAVNNPFAYEALHRAGFGWTGETAGLAELVLSTDAPRTDERYRSGLAEFRDRDLSDAERSFLAGRREASAPAVVADPRGP
jgi:GNAT superfamily N-acetyltransferase